MNANEKLQILETELDQHIERRAKGKERDKKKAFRLKMASVFFAALITILLGLSNVAEYDIILKNLALVLGAIITVVNAYEAFFDHRSLWIRQTVELSRLNRLRFDIIFYKTGTDPDEIDIETVTNLKNRYIGIQQDAIKEWLKLRNEDEKQLDEIQIGKTQPNPQV